MNYSIDKHNIETLMMKKIFLLSLLIFGLLACTKQKEKRELDANDIYIVAYDIYPQQDDCEVSYKLALPGYTHIDKYFMAYKIEMSYAIDNFEVRKIEINDSLQSLINKSVNTYSTDSLFTKEIEGCYIGSKFVIFINKNNGETVTLYNDIELSAFSPLLKQVIRECYLHPQKTSKIENYTIDSLKKISLELKTKIELPEIIDPHRTLIRLTRTPAITED